MPDLSALQLNETMQFVVEIAVALAIGLLIGLEREHSRADDRGGTIIAGIRTFPLVSISGVVISFLSVKLSIPYLIPVGIAVFGFYAALFFFVRYNHEMKGMTTSFALFITFLIGILAGLGYIFYGLVIGVVTTFLLASKHRLHDIAQVFTEDELLGALEFATLALILLPLTYGLTVPKPWGDYIGPGKPFDIFWILMIVTVVSLISLISFLTIRRFGAAQGLEFSGAMGGLINSEAATASLAGIAKKNKCVTNSALIGILLSNMLMLVRNLAICVIADPSLKVVRIMMFPCLIMMLSCVLFTRTFRAESSKDEKIEMSNPFAIVPALKFAVMFAIIAAIAYGATNFPAVIGNTLAGNIAVGFTAIGGFVSSGAVVAPLSSLAYQGHIDYQVAGIVATVACIVSTADKIVISHLCNKNITRKIMLPCLVSAIVGILALIIVWAFIL